MPKKSKRTGHTGHELYQLDGKRTGPWTRQTKLALEWIACVRTGGLGNGKKAAGALKLEPPVSRAGLSEQGCVCVCMCVCGREG